MVRFENISGSHVTTVTDILANVKEDVYAPIKPVVLCSLCSSLASLANSLKQHKLKDVEEVIDAREAAGACVVINEIVRQLLDVMASVEEMLARDKRTRLIEVDVCIGSVTGLAVAAQTKIEVLVSALSNSLDVSTTTRVNWAEYCTWLCGVIASFYCLQKPHIWNKLRSDTSFDIKNCLMTSQLNDKSIVEEPSQQLAITLVKTTVTEGMLTLSTHLKEVQLQLQTIRAVIGECGVKLVHELNN